MNWCLLTDTPVLISASNGLKNTVREPPACTDFGDANYRHNPKKEPAQTLTKPAKDACAKH
ncbi:MAG: hypothetical protein AB8C13_06410 [Phycisphaerales bacterium]